MSAYRRALHIGSYESGSRLALAKELASSGDNVVVLDELIAFRRIHDSLVAEVIAATERTDFEILVSEAKALLGSSTLDIVPDQWLVVNDYGTGTIELWRAS